MAHNKNKIYIKSHTPTTRSRLLSECDLYMSSNDNDPDMKSVKENFDRQTSQRFEEYDERMKDKRQKRKEQRDKNIDEIIKKDRMDKSLAEKVEKCCLICGCGLGGVAAGIGIIGGITISELKKAAMATAIVSAKEAGMAAAKAEGAAAGKEFVIAGLKRMGISTLGGKDLGTYFATTDYTNFKTIARVINSEYQTDSCLIGGSGAEKPICTWVRAKEGAARVIQGKQFSTQETIKTGVENIVSNAETVAGEASKKATEDVIKSSIAAVDAKYVICQNAIIASVVAILVIVLVMIIIYLILRYRRKKKMTKKLQYTKLLNQ
ncbi:hypothetical protein PFNF54_04829 [Plasmodium falciparum NF54]|uniref:Rifin n=1 Tax=Plasmodium falciparum (isolate NF54) TaxID=5843 RepID=W7JMH0_PLAFO|nr:hypothetical protein PFNF54_04829 [Plasmodium falciparum NF54]